MNKKCCDKCSWSPQLDDLDLLNYVLNGGLGGTVYKVNDKDDKFIYICDKCYAPGEPWKLIRRQLDLEDKYGKIL